MIHSIDTQTPIRNVEPWALPEPQRPSTNDPSTEYVDEVEFSEKATTLAHRQSLRDTESHSTRLNHLRNLIKANAYETRERISATADRLLDVLHAV